MFDFIQSENFIRQLVYKGLISIIIYRNKLDTVISTRNEVEDIINSLYLIHP